MDETQKNPIQNQNQSSESPDPQQPSTKNDAQREKEPGEQHKMSIEQVQNDIIIVTKHKRKEIRCGIREGCEDINNFKRLNRIHEGVYGVVYRAEDVKTREIVAIKKLKITEGSDFPITSLREIAILKSICHENIIKIKKVSGNLERDRVYIVMEYMDHEIKALLKESTKFTQEQIKRLMKDLLLGIDLLHQKNIIHRDLKTSNLLYSNQGILKICDFGLARRVSANAMTQEVVSLWYRAPELLLGPTLYSWEIDIWSIGCIFGELTLGEALFQGKNEIEQLDAIFKIVGSPTNETWPNFKELKNGMYVVGNKYQQNKLRSLIPKEKVSDVGLDLMKKLLTPFPKKRINAEKALKHDWFKGPIAQRSEMPTFNPINEMDRVKKVVKT